jgi:hypothetical protein
MNKKPVRNKELEQEFLKAREELYKVVKKQMDIAGKAIDKIKQACEEYGIPAYCNITPLAMRYNPSTETTKKWKDLKEYYTLHEEGELEFESPEEEKEADNISYTIEEILHNSDYDGWEHSAVCW